MYHREPREPVEGDLQLVQLITQTAALVIERKRAEAALRELNETLEARVVEEIAERRAAEVALQRAQKLEVDRQADGRGRARLQQFAPGDLRQPATAWHRTLRANARAERRLANAMAGVNRGAKLANQLLAFGRRQPLEPKVVNIGRLVAGHGRNAAARRIGEAVEMETVIAGGLWNTVVDPTQIENAILNLAINARDAMDGARQAHDRGRATPISTMTMPRHNPDVKPGQYVMIAVTDTGAGMSQEVIEQRIRALLHDEAGGQGHRASASRMVYGFVKQSGGHVKIYSELGHGTTVKIYLPRVDGDSGRGRRTGARGRGWRHGNHPRRRGRRGGARDGGRECCGLGYHVLKAKDAASALPILESGVTIDLLFTDVVMPGPVRSPELARKARSACRRSRFCSRPATRRTRSSTAAGSTRA